MASLPLSRFRSARVQSDGRFFTHKALLSVDAVSLGLPCRLLILLEIKTVRRDLPAMLSAEVAPLRRG
jgi:hypothetical protein